jgi:hypothetical protein
MRTILPFEGPRRAGFRPSGLIGGTAGTNA